MKAILLSFIFTGLLLLAEISRQGCIHGLAEPRALAVRGPGGFGLRRPRVDHREDEGRDFRRDLVFPEHQHAVAEEKDFLDLAGQDDQPHALGGQPAKDVVENMPRRHVAGRSSSALGVPPVARLELPVRRQKLAPDPSPVVPRVP